MFWNSIFLKMTMNTHIDLYKFYWNKLIDPVSYVKITKQEVCKLSKQQITDLLDKLFTELISQINCTDINNQFSAKLSISMECG